ncbi:hypothetical protein K493DRAFT_276528 [Basidiobolus meristosporus CBS 931.73]|uniref:RRM domain-containing protein n=1 Tax=Basidiobolus meristosporus CBS 931.73 TaxID=1314790 RepID=A0A1Y1YZZ3_9FUNG|nr:hypothetical protein K493DRAFT_276528 [Basidiobolus meristosporus CBS 931.73]|eukprot:ORY03434.1 hypothetical protein K493DRAFT_276528 [Basidiobolus meristosporus CBS 931.73]
MNQSEEITTIFVIGFPEDIQDREFQNMFIFSPGFEGATLKFPLGNELEARKQIIGFAKFRSRLEALQARDILSGKKVDNERGCILKAEMAKKNLLIKKMSTPEGAFISSTTSLAQALAPNGIHGSIKKKFGGGVFDALVVGYNPKRSASAPANFDGVGTSFSFPKFNISTAFDQQSMLFGSVNASPTSDHFSFSASSGSDAGLSSSLPSFTSNPSLTTPPTRINAGDQNPPCNTLYVGNLPMSTMEEELRQLFTLQPGYKRLCFRMKPHAGPMCFVEFDDIQYATHSLQELQGHYLSNSIKGGIRLSFSKNPLGVRSSV